ncbi:MAG TPA: cytochrome oxidase small assembly protein [Aquabacterium sp.]|nr:cytochrome oxidase small assembly protein [Aquabacterium sp.]HET6788461.1 cytochrome oxidase small assembly protein [Aquabacterium sp.]HEX5372372.1 cytochrome oxidase small assembly protein [Aquabacterium sp.]
MSANASPQNASVRGKNLRLALILASVVAVFFFGFMLKMTLLAHPN